MQPWATETATSKNSWRGAAVVRVCVGACGPSVPPSNGKAPACRASSLRLTKPLSGVAAEEGNVRHLEGGKLHGAIGTNQRVEGKSEAAETN